ncbi:MAG TPA: Csp1 family four helix bundle copper storage protein [Labilithrix sp.]|nr:Csp1 family four helix bundle copper storage protein [Labilithrix sp.]
MNRRNALITTGSMVVSASLGALACGGNKAVAQNTPKAPPAPPAGGHAHHHGGDPALLEAAQGCLAKGEACLAHCLAMFAAGDTSMGSCGRTVYEMRAVMEGLAAAAASGSKHLPALAKVAAEFCKDCEAECRKHADKHAVCKDCADACTKTIAACQKAAG